MKSLNTPKSHKKQNGFSCKIQLKKLVYLNLLFVIYLVAALQRPLFKESPKMIDTKRSKDIPVTQEMLNDTRKELKSDITSLKLEMKSDFKVVDARFNQVDARFNQVDAHFKNIDARFNQVDARFNQVDAHFKNIDARFNQVDARFNQVDAQLHSLKSELKAMNSSIHRSLVLLEEQEARNKYVLDGYQSLHDRQDHFEQRIEKKIKQIEI